MPQEQVQANPPAETVQANPPVETVQNTPPVKTVQATPAPIPVPVRNTTPAAVVFDPQSITEEKFIATKTDVQALIEDLNRIIRARNYNAWRTYLADSYFEEISSHEFLEERTEELYNRDQIVATNLGRDPRRVSKKILRTAKDYFDNVVVPSRSNDRMDDIDFVSENRVKAYTMDTRGHRLVLYDLEFIGGEWKIIN